MTAKAGQRRGRTCTIAATPPAQSARRRHGGPHVARHVPDRLAPSALVRPQVHRQSVSFECQRGRDRLGTAGQVQEQTLRLPGQQHPVLWNNLQDWSRRLERQRLPRAESRRPSTVTSATTMRLETLRGMTAGVWT